MKSNIKRALALLIALLLALPTAAFADETAPEAAEAVLAVSNDAEALEEIPVAPDEDPVFDHEPEVGEIEFTLGEDEDEPGEDDFAPDQDEFGENDFAPDTDESDADDFTLDEDESGTDDFTPDEGENLIVEDDFAPDSDENESAVDPFEPSPDEDPFEPSPLGEGVEEHSDETDEVVTPSTSPDETDEVVTPSSTPDETDEESPSDAPSVPSPSGAAEGLAGRSGVEERSDETDEVVTPSSTPDETDEESPSDAPSVPSPLGAAEGLAGRSGVEEHSDETDEVVTPSTSPDESDEVVSPSPTPDETDEVASPSSTPDETDEESPSDVTPSDSPSEDPLPDEDENLAEPIDETVEEALPFDQSMTVNGVEVRVSADPGVFPEDAVLSVKRVPSYKARLADAAIEGVRDADQNVAVAYTFDIKVLDAQRGELQPAGGERVEVSFALSEAGDANLAGSVYHITGEGGALTAQPLEVSADGESVTAETDGFSLYTVEFTYNDIQYVMPGDTSVAMDEILSAVGLTGPVDAVRVSDETLFSASDATGAWIVTAHRPFSTHEWMILTINGVEIRVEVTDADTSTGNFAALYDLINAAANGGTVKLEKDYIADAGENPITIHTKVTIDLNGHTINRGLTEATDTGFVINISEGGDVTVKDTPGNGIITGGYYTGSGGGIHVHDGSLTLEGGTITGNHAVSGGGVAVYASTAEAKFIMNGGVIFDNTATFGGGVYVYAANNSNAKASFTMTGGKITGNLATATTTSTYGGGGVYIGSYNGSFTISGGEISDNETTGDYGGGVCCNGSSVSVFQMSGGKITGNKVIRDSKSGHGGGIYLYNDRTFTMSGGEISGNEVKTKSTASGGGVSTSGTFNMTGGVISGNSVSGTDVNNSRGGGVYVNGYGTFTMSGSSTIGGSAATDANSAGKGGGVYVYGGTGGFTMDSGTISNNTTTGSYGGGGGVYVASGAKFTMNSGTISSNTATGSNSNGGGVYVDDGSFTMTNGLINLNKATNLGGGVYVDSNTATFSLSGASKVTNNTSDATTQQRNVFLPSGKTLTISGTLANDASIGVTTSATPSDETPVVITSGLSGKGNASHFTSDKQYGVELNSSNEAVLVNKKFNITVDGNLANGTITADPSPSASGETITLTVTPKTGYELDGVPTVTPASGTVTVSGSGSTYTFTMPPSDVTVTASFKAIPYDLTGTIGKGTGTVSFTVADSAVTTATVGQTVRVVATPADGYQLTKLTRQSADITNNPTFTMPAAGVEVVAEFKQIIHPSVSMSGYTYGSADMPAPAISGAPDGATVTCYYNTTGSTTGGTEWKNMTSTSLPAGTYYIYAVVGETEITLDATTEATQFTVIPATITVTATGFAGAYDGQAHGISVSPSGPSSATVMYGETSESYTLTASPTYTDVGSYTVYYQVTADNYQTVTGSKEVQISSASLSGVRVEQKGEPTYAGQPQTAEVTAEATAVNSQPVTFTYCATEDGTYTTSVPAFTNAGTHTVYYKASAPNHSEASGSFTVTIAQRPITLTADSGSKAYDGKPLTKDSYTLTSGALATGDNITSVTVTGSRIDAGESANVPSEAKIVNGTGGDVTANYAITYANGTLTVTQATPTYVVPTGLTAAYGQKLSDVQLPDASNGTWTWKDPSASVGDVDSRAFAAVFTPADTTNYKTVECEVTVTVSQATPSVTPPTAITGLVYSGSEQALVEPGRTTGGTLKYAVVASGTGSPADDSWGDTCTATGAGAYDVWYKVVGDTNYKSVDAVRLAEAVTIAKASLTVTAEDMEITYGDAPGSFSVTYDKFVGDQNENNLTGTLEYTCNYEQYKGVGSYDITPSGLSSNNYNISFEKGTLTVKPCAVTLTAKNAERVYNSSALTQAEFTADDLPSGDTHAFTVVMTDDSTITGVGTRPNVIATVDGVAVATGTQTAIGNYLVTTANGTLTVNRKAVTLTAKSAERVYNGAPLTEGGFESSGLEAGDSHAFAVAMTAESTITDVGTRPNVIATVDGVAVATGQETIVGNYLVTTAAGTLTITKAANVVTTVPTAAAGLVYSAEDQKLIADAGAARGGTMQYAVTTGGAPADGDWQDGIDAITGKDATAYTVWYRVVGGANYEDVEARSIPVSIAPKPVGLSWGDTSFIYDGDSHAPEATATGVIDGDAVSVSVGGAKTDANAAGEHYTATATGLSGAKAGNYALSDAATQNFTIAPLTVTLSWGGTSFTYDGQPHVPEAAVGNKVDGDDVSVTVGGAKTAAGEHYTATATGLTGAKAGNYALPAEVTKDFTIAPLTVSLSWGGTSFTYDGQPHVPEAAVGNKVAGDEVTVTVDGAKTDANAAGEHYTATAAALDNDNYKLPDAATVDFTIAPREVTLSWGETSFTYDGQPHVPEAAVGNKVGNDEISVTVDGAKTDAGENYTAEATGLTGAKAGNYALPAEVTREFTIAKAAARAIPDVTREVIYTQIANPIEISLAGKMPKNAGTLEYSKGEPEHTGEIQFREAALDPDGQLTLRFDEGGEPDDSFSMTITIRSANYADSTVKVAVTLADKTDAGVSIAQGERVTATYGDGAIALEGIVEDPGHGEGMLTWTSSDEAVATVDEDGVVTIVGAGEATVTASYASDTTKGEAKLVLTVQPKSIDAARVALDVARLTYNGANQSTAVTGVTLDGEPLDAACYAISGALTGRNAGTYTVTVTGAGNYGGAARAQWTIAPKALTVTARPARKSAGDADPALTWTADGLVGGDALTGALTRDAGEAAGVYAIRLGSLSAGDNYALSFTGSQLTIEPRPARADYTLLAAMRTAGSTAFNLTWTDAANAEGYDVFFAACSQNGAYRVIHSAPADAPHQFTVTGVRRTGCYKAYVRAWRMIDGARTYIGDPSPTVHAIAGGYSTKACNARAILLRRARLSLGVGSRKAIGATLEGVRSDRVVLSHARLLRYFSSDANVATVSAAGVVTAVGEGSCQITVMANNGILKTVAVTVHASPTRMRFKKKRYSVKRNRRLNLVKKLSLAPAGLEGALTWESSDPAVVRVSAKGVIRGLKKGTAIITVTAADGRTARTKIRVK